MFHNLFITALWFGALACLLLAMFSLRRRSSLSAVLVSRLLICVFLYAAGYGLELNNTQLPGMIHSVWVEYIGLINITPLWVLLALIYTGRIDRVRIELVIFLWLIPVLVLTALLTNQFHSLYYSSVSVSVSGPFPAFAFTRGPFYWLHIVFTLSCGMITTFLLIRQYRLPQNLFRKQVTIMLAANLFTLTISILYLFGIQPLPGLDIIPFAMILSSVMLGWGILSFHLTDLAPVARDALFERLIDAVLITDCSNRLLDYNCTAARSLGLHTGLIGDPLATFLPAPIVEVLNNPPQDGTRVEVTLHENGLHTLEMYRVELAVQSHTPAGHIIVLHDTTSRTEALLALEMANSELGRTLDELTRFNHAMIGREIRMIELKQEINALLDKEGSSARYVIPEA